MRVRFLAAAGTLAGLGLVVAWVGQRADAARKRPGPGEIVLLHWDPGLGRQLAKLLAVIHARHLHPMPLTLASVAGAVPRWHSLSGD